MARFTEGRAFGVEIEVRPYQVRRNGRQYSLTSQQIARWLNTIDGVDCYAEHYNHQTRNHWKVVSDVSCGWEVVSPLLYGVAGLDAVKAVVQKLRAHGCVVDMSTGLHVHHDVTTISPEAYVSIGVIYNRLQEPINRMFLKSNRVNNSFCRTISNRMLRRLKTQLQTWRQQQTTRRTQDRDITLAISGMASNLEGRYTTVNFSSYDRYGSIEFRQGHGSLNPDEVVAWVVFTQLIVIKAIEVNDVPFNAHFHRLQQAFQRCETTLSGRPNEEARGVMVKALSWLVSPRRTSNCRMELQAMQTLIEARDFEAS